MPKIIAENCTSCGLCVNDCPSDAIELNEFTISNKCIQCGHCAAICPVQAIEMNGQIPEQLNLIPDFKEVESLLAGLRSIRHFKNKEVPEVLIKQIISILKHAPSASNQRKLEITMISDREKIRELDNATTEVMSKVFKWFTNPFVLPIARLLTDRSAVDKLVEYRETFNQRRGTSRSKYSHSAPVVILLHAQKQIGSMYTADANIWATYLTLSARSLGLGTCFIGFYVNAFHRNKKLNRKFNLPKNHTVEAALVLGYPDVQYKNETGRRVPHTNWVK